MALKLNVQHLEDPARTTEDPAPTTEDPTPTTEDPAHHNTFWVEPNNFSTGMCCLYILLDEGD